MNLLDIRSQIYNILDYSPELKAFKDQTDALIEDSYNKIYLNKKWSFAVAETLFDLHPDILPTRDHRTAGSTVTANIVHNSRKVEFSAEMDRLTVAWEGQPIEIQGYEYNISEVVDNKTIYLDRPVMGENDTEDVSWKIKHRFYSLPADCIEILSIGQRDVPSVGITSLWSKLDHMPASTDERYGLELDRTSDSAEAYVPAPPLFIPPGEKISLDVEVTQGQGDDTFTRDTYLEVCWAFEKDGVVGALSEPETIKFTVLLEGRYISGLTAKFVSWDDQEIKADSWNLYDRKPSPYEGFRKVLFWNANMDRTTGKRIGRPCWKEIITGGASRNTTSYLDPLKAPSTDSEITIDSFVQCSSGNNRYVEYDGQHLMIRPYPRPDSWTDATVYAESLVKPSTLTSYVNTAILRYYKKPQPLRLGTDVPEMPYEFHQLIVYSVLEEIYMKLGQANMAQIYSKRIADNMKELTKRYVTRTDSVLVKGGNSLSGMAGPFNGYVKLRYLG